MSNAKREFDDIEVGDNVIVVQNNHMHIGTVDKVTKTQIVVGPQRFRRKDGWLAGGNSWATTHIVRAEGLMLDKARRQRLAFQIWTYAQAMRDRTALAKLDIASLTQIAIAAREAARLIEAAGEVQES